MPEGMRTYFLEGERTREPLRLPAETILLIEKFGRAASRLAGTLVLQSRLGVPPNE